MSSSKLVLAALARMYYVVLDVDVRKNSFEIINSPDNVREVLSKIKSATDCFIVFRDKLIKKAYRKAVSEFLDVKNWKNIIDNGKYYVEYEGVFTGWSRISIVKSSSMTHFLVLVEDINEYILREGKLQTAEKKITENEQESEAMKAINDAINSGIWNMSFNEKSEMTNCYWSNTFRHMLGYENEEDFPNVFESWTDLLHPEEKDYILKEYWDTVTDFTGAKTFDVTCRLFTKNKGYRWFHAAGRLSRRKDGSPVNYYGIFIDVDIQTEANLIQQKQIEEKDMIRSFLNERTYKEHANDSMIEILARLGGIYDADRAYIFEFDEEKDTATNTYEWCAEGVFPVKDELQNKPCSAYRPFFDSFRQHHEFILENVETVKGNALYDILYSHDVQCLAAVPFLVSGTLVGFLGIDNPRIHKDSVLLLNVAAASIYSEVLHLRHQELAVRNKELEITAQHQQALEDALHAAEHANKAKTTFLNNMSHDIRTPMNAIIGFTTLAATHYDDKEKVKDYLEKIQISSKHLLSLINDVLDMSRIESGKIKLDEKPVLLPEVMHDIRTIVQSDVTSKRLDFYIDTVDVVNEAVICDKLRLNQILLNLLSNAMKFTKPGGTISLRIIQKPESPTDYASYDFVVKDTGIGMAPDFIAHVFEPFEREQTSTVSGIQGSGLGMSITKNIVDMMGGTINVESEKDKGSTFTVSLDFKTCGKKVKTEPIPAVKDMRALVVDDDFETCASVTKMLSSIGMRPDFTTLGKDAVLRSKLAVEQGDEYKAYIIDWLMPDMNGVEVVRRVRKLTTLDIPIIILTAYDFSEIEEEAKEAGVTAFISKPIFMSDLRDVLENPEKVVIAQKEESFDFTGKRVLLAEDNLMNQEIAAEILKEAGFIVDVADDGNVAVEKIQKIVENPSSETSYDLILMDVQMPKMNGYEATKAIRALNSDYAKNIPIFAMTANAFEEDKKLAFESGMNGHFTKPVEIPKLMKALENEFLKLKK